MKNTVHPKLYAGLGSSWTQLQTHKFYFFALRLTLFPLHVVILLVLWSMVIEDKKINL